MKLTGKCKEDFNKWIQNEFEPNEQGITVNASYEGDMEVYASENFNILPQSMQYGVYVDFFDSVVIYIEDTVADYTTPKTYLAWVNADIVKSCKTRQEARTAAIEKANKIYNKQ